MIINTCSEAMSLAKDLENKSAQFYRHLSDQFPQHKELFLSFVKENENYITQIDRAYYGVITDAFEGCFAFNMDPETYVFRTELTEKASHSDVLERAIEIEEKIIKFYTEAAEQSKSLMADVPRAFKMVAKKRGNRLSTLKTLIEGKG